MEQLVKQNIKTETFIEKTFKNSVCELCDQKFTAEYKYQCIQQLLKHKNTCLNKMELNTQYRTKKVCDKCDYAAKSETDLKNHMRYDHLDYSTSASPPPKKRRQFSNEEENKQINMEIDEVSLKIDNLDITMNDDESEKLERKKRSIMMDQKVARINKNREEEETKEMERRKMVEARTS